MSNKRVPTLPTNNHRGGSSGCYGAWTPHVITCARWRVGEGKAEQEVGMRLGAGRDPRAEEGLRGVSGSCGNEFVGRLTKRTVRTKGDRAEANVELLLADDLRGPAVLGR